MKKSYKEIPTHFHIFLKCPVQFVLVLPSVSSLICQELFYCPKTSKQPSNQTYIYGNTHKDTHTHFFYLERPLFKERKGKKA